MSKLLFSEVLFLLLALGSCSPIPWQQSHALKELHMAVIKKEQIAVDLAHIIDVEYFYDSIFVNRDFYGEYYWMNPHSNRPFTTTIINLALFYNQINVVEILIERGASVFIWDHYGNTALHVASCLGHKSVVKIIVEQLAPQDINDPNKAGINALQMAIHYKRADVIEELLKKFADPFITDISENTALHLAIDGSFGKELISMIIEAAMQQIINNLGQNGMTDPCRDSDIVREEMSKFINLQNRNGKTALMMAVRNMNCCVEIVDLLFKNGADPFITDRSGNTALHLAIYKSFGADLISMIIEAAMQQIINNLGQNGMTDPCRDRDMIREEMSKFINSKNDRGRSALHLAFEFQGFPVETIKILLKHDADPRIPDNNRKTALDRAIQKEQHDAITEIVNAVRNLPKLHVLQHGMTPPLYSGSINRSKHHHLPSGIISDIFTDDMIKQWKRSAENALKWAMRTMRDDLVDSLKIICDDITETGQPIDSSKQLPSVINDC